MRSILVTRPHPAAEELAAKLRREGHAALAAPMLSYEAMEAEYPPASSYHALAFTSAQGARACAAHIGDKEKPVFCVGDATAAAARQEGFRNVQAANSDARALARMIQHQKDKLHIGRVLHVCGDDTAQDLRPLLFPGDIHTQRLPVYKAKLADRPPPEAERALKLGEIDTIMFFSARVAAHMARMLSQKEWGRASRKIEALCISPRVARELDHVPWKAVRVATRADTDSMLALAREKAPPPATRQYAAAAVIAAFGGIRPLANGLGVTASTVQGWKKRNLIPENRIDAILAAAGQAGIDPEHLLKEAVIPMTTEDQPTGQTDKNADQKDERRGGADRRTRRVPPDEKGNITTRGYAGPDRRAGIDRRAYQERQRQKIWREKLAFLNYTTVSVGFFFTAVVLAVYFVLAPEIAEMDRNARRVREMEAQMESMTARLEQMRQQEQKRQGASIGSKLNRAIETVQNTGGDVTEAVKAVAAPAMDSAMEASGASQLIGVLSTVQAMNRTQEGRAMLETAMGNLRAAMGVAPGDAAGLDQAVSAAKSQDPALDALLSEVDRKNLGAAALLLTVNELRGKIGGERPFADDLAIVRKFAGRDPETQAALTRLAPYAESGVLSRGALQKEFKGLAFDIVTAKLEGEDLTVREAALRRLSRFVQVRNLEEVEGNSPDAVVARAQRLLDEGKVRDAITELQKLEGPPAEAAEPWVQQASGHVLAEESTGALTQAIFAALSPPAAASALSASGVEAQVTPVLENIIEQIKQAFTPASQQTAPYISPSLQGEGPAFPAR